jgi:hypothetical protein
MRWLFGVVTYLFPTAAAACSRGGFQVKWNSVYNNMARKRFVLMDCRDHRLISLGCKTKRFLKAFCHFYRDQNSI